MTSATLTRSTRSIRKSPPRRREWCGRHLDVSPNPVDAQHAIVFDRGDYGLWMFELFTMAGESAGLLAAGDAAQGRFRASGDVRSVTAGRYLLRLLSDNGIDVRQEEVRR